MILYGSTMSPFARMVRVVARETGAIEIIREVIADPWGDDTFRRINPLGKIPAFLTDEDDVLYDSPVICEYLDASRDGPPLFPPQGRHRWRTLTLHACAYGLMDAAYLRRNEAIRPQPGMISKSFIDRQDAAIGAALDAFEADIEQLAASLTIASIAAGTALGYLDFRYPDCGWRTRCPVLADWWSTLGSRPSFAGTEHTDPPGVIAPSMALALRLSGEEH